MTSFECGGQRCVEKGVSRKVHFASHVGTVHGQNAIKIGVSHYEGVRAV